MNVSETTVGTLLATTAEKHPPIVVMFEPWCREGYPRVGNSEVAPTLKANIKGGAKATLCDGVV